MKTTIHFIPYRPPFKFVRTCFIHLFVVSQFIFPLSSFSQCTNYTINWDYLDFFHSSATWYNTINPSTGQPFVTNTMKQTQNFAMGPTNNLTIASSIPVGSSGSFWGEVTDHSGETGGYGSGADVKYVLTSTGSITLTLTFLNEVQNLKFSLYDIDQKMRTTITAVDASSTALNVTVTKPAGTSSAIQLNGDATATTLTGTSVIADLPLGGGSGTDYPSTGNLGTINIDITGPVKTVSINFINSAGTRDFWLSDITACSPDPSFPSNYYSSYTQPYAGQPAYFLANPDYNLNVYMVDPVNRTADLLFTDPGAGGNALNSLAYDPINKYVYYVMNGSGASAGNRAVKRYNLNTNTITTVIPDINTLGIPTFTQGIEAASAAFYNGCLYLGVEGTNPSNFATNTESTIWRIDLDGSGNAIRASQVFGVPSDNGGGQPSHDWGDFIIKDGTIITHASNLISPAYQSSWIHFNMTSSAATNTYTAYADTSGQLGQIYNGTIYRVDNQIALYNNNGTTAAANTISVTSCSPAWNNRPANDASDPFRPALDFGDAPSTYDPVALSPAANQQACNNSTLRIGSVWDREWTLGSSSDASGDGTDEDGISTVTVMVSDGIPYNHVQEVTVLNNTGATAYLAGWLDYNANGLFDASEGTVVAVPSGGSPQTISLGWTGITVAPGTPNTFLRVRLYSGTLTANDATGWLSDGETEDYPVLSQSMPLAIQLLDFNATLTRDKNVLLTWNVYTDNDAMGFEVERSRDQNVWEKIAWVDINTSVFTSDYSLLDQQPLLGKSYYRLKMVEKSASSRFSSIRPIQIDQLHSNFKIYPNPVKTYATVSFNSTANQSATLILRSVAGERMIKKSIVLNEGDNRVQLAVDGLSNGLYIVELVIPGKTFVNKLTVTH